MCVRLEETQEKKDNPRIHLNSTAQDSNLIVFQFLLGRGQNQCLEIVQD